MTETGYFLAGLAICTSVVLTIIIVIHRRFLIMMEDLCEGKERANFWTLAVEAWFALYSVSSALKWTPEGISGRQLFMAGIKQVKDGLNGTSTAIIMFSVRLVVFVLIRKFRGAETDILRRKDA